MEVGGGVDCWRQLLEWGRLQGQIGSGHIFVSSACLCCVYLWLIISFHKDCSISPWWSARSLWNHFSFSCSPFLYLSLQLSSYLALSLSPSLSLSLCLSCSRVLNAPFTGTYHIQELAAIETHWSHLLCRPDWGLNHNQCQRLSPPPPSAPAANVPPLSGNTNTDLWMVIMSEESYDRLWCTAGLSKGFASIWQSRGLSQAPWPPSSITLLLTVPLC